MMLGIAPSNVYVLLLTSFSTLNGIGMTVSLGHGVLEHLRHWCQMMHQPQQCHPCWHLQVQSPPCCLGLTEAPWEQQQHIVAQVSSLQVFVSSAIHTKLSRQLPAWCCFCCSCSFSALRSNAFIPRTVCRVEFLRRPSLVLPDQNSQMRLEETPFFCLCPIPTFIGMIATVSLHMLAAREIKEQVEGPLTCVPNRRIATRDWKLALCSRSSESVVFI